MRVPTGANSASVAGGVPLYASRAVKTFFMRVAISLLRDLLYRRDVSAVRCLFNEFCLASTIKAAATTLVRCGRAAKTRSKQVNLLV